ncbi:MAG TPA: hypothetical protein VKR58_13915, partial [Aquella sp.]|nr:hypothetical protein [Aquella sp.]
IGFTFTSLTTTKAVNENQNITSNNELDQGNISIEAAGRKPMPVLKLTSRDLNESRFVARHGSHSSHSSHDSHSSHSSHHSSSVV